MRAKEIELTGALFIKMTLILFDRIQGGTLHLSAMYILNFLFPVVELNRTSD